MMHYGLKKKMETMALHSKIKMASGTERVRNNDWMEDENLRDELAKYV
jgi:hypothetical protein